MRQSTSTEPGYELEDVRTSKLVWAGVVLAAIVLAAVAAMTLMFGLLKDAREPVLTETVPMAELDVRPEGPILQVDPPKELIEMRVRDANTTTTYGWVNRETGIVRIPIERAMQLVVERGIE